MTTPMMKCGHNGHAKKRLTNGTYIPCCVICLDINPGADVIDENPPDLSKREAICSYGCSASVTKSSPELAFFEHRPKEPRDRYYCGCFGWD